MQVQDTLAHLGGCATTQQLRATHSANAIRAAVAGGRVVRTGRGHYALRSAHEALREAARLRGTVSHLSAALLHGWGLAREPRRPWITVPEHRKRQKDETVRLVFGTPSGQITGPLTTVIDCARMLPWCEALAVADSALRSGMVTREELASAAAAARGPGSRQVRRVAAAASAKADNPMESVLRAIALDVSGLAVVPQVDIDLGAFTVHPDLVDEELGIVLEAEGRYHQTDSLVFVRDVERYTLLTVQEWMVLRFTYGEILHRQAYVTECLAAVVAVRRRCRACRTVRRGNAA